MAVPWEDLVAGVKKGNLRALAKMITRIENRDSGWKDAMKAIYPDTGATLVFGITGAPGAGKSTLTNRIALGLVSRGYQVGIIAVDPSSPFSGGALLGDRLRMQDIATIEGIFIRSMATRGTLGGLCQGARDVIRIMDAFGKDVVLIETVGVGQDEIEVVRAADPRPRGLRARVGRRDPDPQGGDHGNRGPLRSEQGRPGGRRRGGVRHSGHARAFPARGGSRTSRAEDIGRHRERIESLVNTLVQFKEDKARQGRDEATRVREEILTLMEQELFHHIRSQWAGNGALQAAVRQVINGEQDPYSVAEDMLSTIKQVDFEPASGNEKRGEER